ncbi:MAG TPA: ubiquinol-cytochrome C chaperone family protein [Magnetospirillaceae bacterium]|jgi:cytochrome b pre-mRNA-processing protein 3
MLKRLFGPTRTDQVAATLYEAAVAQARRPEFYLHAAVPDTLDGRFDLLSLHVFLIFYRLRDAGQQAGAVSQALFDHMFTDMDENLREIGVGDLSVGRKVKTMVKALMGRIAAYEPGLSDPAVLAEALGRNLYRGKPVAADAVARVAQYMTTAVADLAEQGTDSLLIGKVHFPEPVLA